MGSPTVPSTFRDFLLCLQRGGGWQGLSRPWRAAAVSLLHSSACRNPCATQNGLCRYSSELSQPSSRGEERRPGSLWQLPLNPAVHSQYPHATGTGTHFLTGSSPYFISSRMAVGAV